MTVNPENKAYFDIRVKGSLQDKFIEIMKKRLKELDKKRKDKNSDNNSS